MPKQSRPHEQRDDTMPNRAANRDPAEGSRETVEGEERSGRIANRPRSEEQANQERVPPRGEAKGDAHA
jgi:hypothetical protein